MFRPNNSCVLALSSQKTDVYGQPLPRRKVKEGCSIVSIKKSSVKSSVRADSSASRGSAYELEDEARILLSPKTKAQIDDVIEIAGFVLRIVSKSPEFSVLGKLDHYVIEATTWRQA